MKNPLLEITEVVFYGDEGFADANSILLIQPDKLRVVEMPYFVGKRGDYELRRKGFETLELPYLQPQGFPLLAVHKHAVLYDENGAPVEVPNLRVDRYLFVEQGGFEFRPRENFGKDFAPVDLKVKEISSGILIYLPVHTDALEAEEISEAVAAYENNVKEAVENLKNSSFAVQGAPLTQETLFIAALVAKAGGQAELTREEINAVSGLIIESNEVDAYILRAN